MLEISPVLAGTFDTPDYAPANNFASATNASTSATASTGTSAVTSTASTDDVTAPDPRRYTKFDHSDTEAGSTTNFSFSDLVDMLNPLEHIPVISSVYRAITGEEINPVARVAGDILYGGMLGGASAVLGGVSAIADAGLEAETGKDSGGLVLAALFGDDNKKDAVQLADASGATGTAAGVTAPAPMVVSSPTTPTTKNIELAAATPTPLLAALALPANVPASSATTDTSAFNAAANTNAPHVEAAPAVPVTTAPSSTPAHSPAPPPVPVPAVSQNTALTSGVALASAGNPVSNAPVVPASLGGIPLAPAKSPANKQPYGGVMAPTNAQAQDMALALAQGTPGMRMGHMIYTNQLMNGAHPLPPMLSNGHASSGPPVAVIGAKPVLPTSFTPVSTLGPAAALATNGQTLAGSPQSTALPAGLMQDMMMKALSQYGNAAAGPSSLGGTVNLVN